MWKTRFLLNFLQVNASFTLKLKSWFATVLILSDYVSYDCIPFLCVHIQLVSWPIVLHRSLVFEARLYFIIICDLRSFYHWSGPFIETELFKNKVDGGDLLSMVLKLPWTQPIVVSEPHPPWKTKCTAVRVFSKLGQSLTTESDFEILDLACCDESEEVRIEAIICLPVVVLWSGLNVLPHIFKRLE